MPLLSTTTRAMKKSPTKKTARGGAGTRKPIRRKTESITSSGQRWRVKVLRRRHSPPNAMPAAIPAITPLASMGVAHERLAREPPSELRQRLVVDRRQVVGLERVRPAPLDARLQCSDAHRIELGPLVAVQLLHRSVVARCLAIDSVRRHGFVRVGDDEDARADRDLFTLQALRIAGAIEVFVMSQNDRD